jgi:hypothetical protein
MSSMDAFQLNDFPKLDLNQIRKSIGSYQIKQSKAYVADNLNQDGQFKLLINNKIESDVDGNIIYAEIQSRQAGNTEYTVLIKYTPNIDCPTSIKAWMYMSFWFTNCWVLQSCCKYYLFFKLCEAFRGN